MYKKLTVFGMVGAVIYLLHVVIGGFLWKGYSHLKQPISDLTSNGAPDRAFLTGLTVLYAICSLIFAFCAFMYVRKFGSKLLRIGFFLFFCMHIVSITYNLFPEDMVNTQMTFTGFMHIVVTVLIIPLTLVSVLLIGIALRKVEALKSYSLYSILTSVFMFVAGGLTVAFMANKIGYFGLSERLNIGALQLWMFLMSYKLFMMPENKKITKD